MIGGAITGIVADRFGRKGGLLLNNVFVIAATILEGQCLNPFFKTLQELALSPVNYLTVKTKHPFQAVPYVFGVWN